ncbi:MAG: hypothetical protein M3314_12565 [Actinomycetota bacterium]|nr:hypothetical protein [Actinomycetota bacterium]
MTSELPRMDEHTPHGDPLEPKREQAEGAEPMPGELRSELDQIEQQPIETVGPPGAGSPEASGGTEGGRTGAAKGQAEDEGPTAEGGGQSLETAGGGGF